MLPALSRRLVLAGALLLPLLGRRAGRAAPALAPAPSDQRQPASSAAQSATPSASPSDPLPSWRPGPSRDRILAFLRAVSTPGSPQFVPPEERIAVFDNDGTLWSEQPMYVQLAFALDRARILGVPVDRADLMARGNAALLDLLTRTHTGMDTEAFAALVRRWLAEAHHPTLRVPYTALAYRPMLEVLAAFRAAGFRTWIVTGGGLDFVRVFAERLYGVPPEQVVGSSVVTRYDDSGDVPRLLREPRLEFLDDGPGKPVGIHRAIGRRPIAAFGNSDGDLAMLRWVTSGSGPRLGMLVHHDDPRREVAYDRSSPFGRLDRGLEQAPARGWGLISMREEWAKIYAGSEGP
jgi:hypothetical protein